MSKQKTELADIFSQSSHLLDNISFAQKKVIRAITTCRTKVLGGHLEKCSSCSFEKNSYNSCRNRHCPKCQFLTKEKWIEKRSEDLLPCPYFHVVFSVPSQLRNLIFKNKREGSNLMFKAAAATLKEAAANPKNLGAEIGFIGILHTWTQDLRFHPHLHFLVPAGGLTPKGDWKQSSEKFFLSVKILSKMFKGKLLSSIEKHPDLILPKEMSLKDILVAAAKPEWVVYSKQPFAGPEQVIKYLGHYTHRIAISNYRIVKHEGGKVYFKVRDKKNEGKSKICVLEETKFMRRFLLHVVPKGYTRIRHFGILGTRSKTKKLAQIRQLLGVKDKAKSVEKTTWQEDLEEITGIDAQQCPKCKVGKLRKVIELPVSIKNTS